MVNTFKNAQNVLFKQGLTLPFKEFWNHLSPGLQNIQLSLYCRHSKGDFFKCVIVLDNCCSEFMHVIEFDLGLVVKEELADFLERKVFGLRGRGVLFSNQSPTRSHSPARTQEQWQALTHDRLLFLPWRSGTLAKRRWTVCWSGSQLYSQHYPYQVSLFNSWLLQRDTYLKQEQHLRLFLSAKKSFFYLEKYQCR